MVYSSLTPETAMAETLAHYRYYGIPVEDAMPRTFVAIKTKLAAIVDFRTGELRRRMQISLDRMLSLDWRSEVHAGREPITQMLGHAASDVGLEGMIVPSSAHLEGHNLIVFPQNLRRGSEIHILNPNGLTT